MSQLKDDFRHDWSVDASGRASFHGLLPWRTQGKGPPSSDWNGGDLDQLRSWTREMSEWGARVARCCVELNRELGALEARVDQLERAASAGKG